MPLAIFSNDNEARMFMEKGFWDKANQQAGTLNVPFQQLTVKRYMTYFMNWNMSNVRVIKSVAFL